MVRNLILFIILLASECGIYAQDWNEFERWVEEMRVQWKVPGVAVAVVKEDKVVFIKGFGVRRIDESGPVDPETIFQLASVSKVFTAAGLGVGVDKGLLKWDEEIIKNLPQFALKDSYPSRFATARDLLAHRTGLPAFRGDLLGKMGYSSEEILYRVRFIEPATSFRNLANYSNVGFFVAGELLGKIFKTSWEKAISTQLLIPLEMKRSGFRTHLDQQNVAAAHAMIDG